MPCIYHEPANLPVPLIPLRKAAYDSMPQFIIVYIT